MKIFKYARCKKSEKPLVQLLRPGYVFYTKCASCGDIIDFESDETFENHFEFFEIKDKWYDGMFEAHIKRIETNPDKYKI